MKRHSARWCALAALLAALAACFAISLCAGASGMSARRVWELLRGTAGDAAEAGILFHIRMPRAFAACLCGAALATSGLLLQTALGNGLASPGTIGVNSGAGFAVVLAAVLFPPAPLSRVAAAFVGAMLTALMVYGLACKTGASRLTIVMAGLALSSLLSAASDALVTLWPDALLDRSTFSIGGFGSVTMASVQTIAPFIGAGLLAAFWLSPGLNLLLLGDAAARSLGLTARACRFMAIVCAALLAAAAVSIGGLLSFLGLLAPHMARFLVGNDARWQVPLSALGGATLLLVCDTLARTLFAPYELPVGILLSFLGVPFFLGLLFTRKRRGEL